MKVGNLHPSDWKEVWQKNDRPNGLLCKVVFADGRYWLVYDVSNPDKVRSITMAGWYNQDRDQDRQSHFTSWKEAKDCLENFS